MMTPSNDCYNLTISSEGCRLKAYQDTGGVWTIGYGHTNAVRPGQVITQQVAKDLLALDIRSAVACINTHALPCAQGQFDALVDFTFNVGPAQFLSSHLFAFHRSRQYDKAADEFPKWKFDNGKVEPGLVERRANERALYTRQGLAEDHQQTDVPEHSDQPVVYSASPGPGPNVAPPSPVQPVPTSSTAPVSNTPRSEFVSQALALARNLLASMGKGKH